MSDSRATIVPHRLELNRVRQRLVALVLPVVLLLPGTMLPCAAWADSGFEMMRAYSTYIGTFGEFGRTEYGGGKLNPGTQSAYGFRYYERQGIITGTVTAILLAMGAAQEANSAKSVESHKSGNYVVTTTTYHSASERAAIMASGTAAAGAAASAKDQSFDLEIFSRNLGGTASGWRMNSYYGFPFWRMMFEFGLGLGSIDTALLVKGQSVYSSYAYWGMPMRLDYGGEFAWFFLEADWNFAGYGYRANLAPTVKGDALLLRSIDKLPWKLGVASSILGGRIFGEAVATTPGISSAEFAIKTTVGVRF